MIRSTLSEDVQKEDSVTVVKRHGSNVTEYDGIITKTTSRTVHVELKNADRKIIFSKSTGKQWGGNDIVNWTISS